MAVPSNILTTVITRQLAELAWMLNQNVAINLADKKFINFNQMTANLGDTVSFDIPPRAGVATSLILGNIQSSVQRIKNLTCSQAANSPMAFNDQQFIFNVEEYMERFGMAHIKALGSEIEKDLLLNFSSSVRIKNSENPNNGQLIDPTSGPFRFYGNGVTPIDSYQNLAQALANFREPGAADYNTCGILPMTYVPPIVGTGLNQFVPIRNETIADDWMVGKFSNCNWYQSNLLPTHIAGNVGNATTPSNQLTVISTNDPTGANITQITLSGATVSDVDALKNGDLGQFVDGVSGYPDLRYMTFIGGGLTAQPVQIRVVGDTAADSSGHVTITIQPGLTAGVSPLTDNWQISSNITAGMKIQFLPSHKVGAIFSGNPLKLAMPKLPDTEPFSSVSTSDDDTGVSIRHYWGSQLGQNTRIYAYDSIWGSFGVGENMTRLVFPLT